MCNAKRYLFISFLVLMVCGGSAQAQDVPTDAFSDFTYNCYITINQIDVINTELTFKERAGLELSKYEGDGFYISILNYFIGTYITLDQRIGSEPQADYFFLLNGITYGLSMDDVINFQDNTFISGFGIVIQEYEAPYFLFFTGVRVFEDEEE